MGYQWQDIIVIVIIISIIIIPIITIIINMILIEQKSIKASCLYLSLSHSFHQQKHHQHHHFCQHHHHHLRQQHHHHQLHDEAGCKSCMQGFCKSTVAHSHSDSQSAPINCRQACLSHHQIVIWICFWFNICQTQQKYQQIVRRPCCLLLLPSVPVFQWVVTFLSSGHKQSNARLLQLPHLTPYHPSPHIPSPSFAMWRIFLPSTSPPSARSSSWPRIRVRNISVTIWRGF